MLLGCNQRRKRWHSWYILQSLQRLQPKCCMENKKAEIGSCNRAAKRASATVKAFLPHEQNKYQATAKKPEA